MADTVLGTILEVSRQLNDQDTSAPNLTYLRWSQDDLLEYYNDSLRQIAAIWPNVTMQSIGITLVPGTIQYLPPNALELININFGASSTCVEGSGMTRVDLSFLRSFNRRDCRTTALYRPHNWAYEADNPKTFYVHPEVPGNAGAYVQAAVRVEVPTMLAINVPHPFGTRFHGPTVSWMQARAYEVDQESESSFKLAAQHRADFFRTMKLLADAEKALHDGSLLPSGRRR